MCQRLGYLLLSLAEAHSRNPLAHNCAPARLLWGARIPSLRKNPSNRSIQEGVVVVVVVGEVAVLKIAVANEVVAVDVAAVIVVGAAGAVVVVPKQREDPHRKESWSLS